MCQYTNLYKSSIMTILFKVFKKEELEVIAGMCIKHNCMCISDEVYEWITYDEHKHVRIGEDFAAVGRSVLAVTSF